MTGVRRYSRRIFARLVAALRADTVRPYVWGYYIAILAWGLYGTFFAGPISIIEPAMGHLVYDLWVWTCIAAPAMVMIGMGLRTGFGRYIGLWLQIGGNAAVGLVLAAYEYAMLVGIPWGYGSFAVFIVPPYIIGCVLLTAQAAVQLCDVLKLAHKIGVAA